MHTDHSHDRSVPVADLLDYAEVTAAGAIAITDHNVFSGAQEAVKLARGRRLTVIPGEEIKTDSGRGDRPLPRGEIARGLSMADTIAAIREQGGVVYVPHPFDRLHTIPDARTFHRHLSEIDVFEVYNARLLFEGFNEEALRFARKYNLTMGAGSDAHVLQGVGTGLVRMRAFETPPSSSSACDPPRSLRRPKSLVYLQGLKWVAQSRARAASKAAREEEGRRAPNTLSNPLPVPTDDISQRYLEKAIAEINDLGARDRPGCRLGTARWCLGPATRRPTASSSNTAPRREQHEGVAFFGRAAQPVLESLQRLHVDPTAIYGDELPQVLGTRTRSKPGSGWRARSTSSSRSSSSSWGRCPLVPERRPLSARGRDRERAGSIQRFTPTIDALLTPDLDASLDEAPAKREFWEAFKAMGSWWSELPPY